VAMEIRAALDRPLDASSESTAGITGSDSLPEFIARLVGGTENIRSASHHYGRWRVELVNADLVSKPGPKEPIRSIARVAPNLVHVLVS
jgi:N-acetylglucosamine PTS system EIICBA or EIICB component